MLGICTWPAGADASASGAAERGRRGEGLEGKRGRVREEGLEREEGGGVREEGLREEGLREEGLDREEGEVGSKEGNDRGRGGGEVKEGGGMEEGRSGTLLLPVQCSGGGGGGRVAQFVVVPLAMGRGAKNQQSLSPGFDSHRGLSFQKGKEDG